MQTLDQTRLCMVIFVLMCFFFVIVFLFDINGENISCAKKFLEAKMKCKVNALRENNHSRY